MWYINLGNYGRGCVHAAAPDGCAWQQAKCACGWTGPVTRCGNDAFESIVVAEHADACSLAGLERPASPEELADGDGDGGA